MLGIVALGQTFLVAAGQLDLSVGSLASLSAVMGATLLRDGQPEAVAVAVCVVMGAGIGLVWGLLVTGLRVPPFILTLGGLSVLQSLAMVRAGDVPVPVRDGFDWLNRSEVLGLRAPILAFLLVAALAALVLRYTRFGRHVFATGSSEEASYLAGLPTDRTKVVVFVLNGALVAFAGLILMTRIGAGDPRAGSGLELRAIAAVVLGGATLGRRAGLGAGHVPRGRAAGRGRRVADLPRRRRLLHRPRVRRRPDLRRGGDGAGRAPPGPPQHDRPPSLRRPARRP